MILTKKRCEVLFISRDFPPTIGGVSTYNRQVLHFFRSRSDIFFHVITLDVGGKQRVSVEEQANARITRLPHSRLLGNPDGIDILDVAKIIKYTKAVGYCVYLWWGACRYLWKNRTRIDVLYGTGGLMMLLVVSGLFWSGKRRICHFHIDEQFERRHPISRWFWQVLCRHCDWVCVNSHDSEVDMQRAGMSLANVVCIHNWIDYDLFQPIDKAWCREQLGLPEDKFVFAFIARLSSERYLSLVLDAAALLAPCSSRILFCIIGHGPERNRVDEYARRFPIIRVIGSKPNSELPLWINAANLTWGICDGYYVALNTIESLACGVPALAVNRAHPDYGKWDPRVRAETLPEDVGFLVEPNAQTVAEKIQSLEKDARQLADMASNCRSFVRMTYGYKNAERLYSLLTLDRFSSEESV